MNYLLKKGFLKEKPGNPIGKVYYITEKGKKFNKRFKNLINLME
jgi:predicted transcriptional regulator